MSKRFWPVGPAMWLISRRSQGVSLTATMALLLRRASRPNNICNSHCCSYLGGRKSHWTIRRSHQWCRWHCTHCKSGSRDRDPCGSVPLSLIGDWDWDWDWDWVYVYLLAMPGQGPPADHAAPGGRHQKEASNSLPAGDLISPWLPPWSVGPVPPGASPPERSALPPELAAAPQ